MSDPFHLKDVCECGDYRDQHPNDGPCIFNGRDFDLTHGGKDCAAFRLDAEGSWIGHYKRQFAGHGINESELAVMAFNAWESFGAEDPEECASAEISYAAEDGE